MMNAASNSNKKGGLFSRPKLRGKDLNLRPLGYEPNLIMSGPFVSWHFVTLGTRFSPLFSNFCEHFVSTNRVSGRLQNHVPLGPCLGAKSSWWGSIRLARNGRREMNRL